ncbi:hypothetical protein [Micromonospora sp. NPDC005305]|uniref:hypothetical protein n=1 Tax=Micromonospora sp. NPDC005305 TaxID=3156875 RepID=UPI0033A9E973
MLTRPRRAAALGGLLLLAAVIPAAASPAAAMPVPFDIYQVIAPGQAGTHAHTAPSFGSPTTAFLPNGTQLDVNCRSRGESGQTRVLVGATTDNPEPHWADSTTSDWVRLADGSWVFDGHTNTDPVDPSIGSCDTTPLLTAPNCLTGEYDCNDHDPEVSRCVTSGLVKLASAPIGDANGGTVELWYSRGCRAGWVRAKWPQPTTHFTGRTDAVTLTVWRQDNNPVITEGRPSNLLWSRMATAQRGECIFGQVEITTAAGTHTSPELHDCS